MLLLRRCVLIAVCLGALATTWADAAPTIGKITPRALRRGATTTIVVEGSELLAEPRVLCDAPLARVAVKPNATPQRVEVEIELAATVPPGFYAARWASASGVSNPVVLAVDDLPTAPFAAEIPALPTAVHGVLEGGAVLRTAFSGQKDGRVVLDVESRRIGGKLNPVVRLLDERGRQLAYAMPDAALAGDARLETRLPADGRYTVELSDMLYRGEGPGHFRLKIGDLSYADQMFPLAVSARATGATALIPLGGGFPPEAKADLDYRGPAGAIRPPLPAVKTAAAAQARLVASEFPEFIEGPPPAPPAPQAAGAAPVGINGRLGRPGEEDRYLVAVTPGAPLKIECYAARVGSPLDLVLSVSKPDGGQLASNDDRPNQTDPGLEVTPPAGVNAIVIAVKDLTGPVRSGAYRITVVPANQPTFQLSLSDERQLVPAGGAVVLRIKAERQGYAGPIKLSPTAMPPGVQWSGDTIPAGATEALVALSAPAGAALQAGLVSVRGESLDPAAPGLVREALVPENDVSRLVPSARRDLAIATTPAAPLSLEWTPGVDDKLPLGGQAGFRVKVVRAANAAGAVRLSLISTHTPPKKTVKVDNKDQQVDDLERTLRFEGAPIIPADQAEASGAILVPADLAAAPYDLAIKGELLGPDGKTVQATAVTLVRRLTAAK